MEFDEMKRIWDSQNHQPLYVINENALHRRILSKTNQNHHITNISELLWIIGNTCVGGIVLGVNLFKQNESILLYLLSGWMLGTALYMLVSRIHRIKKTYRFDRSIHGDLDHAISAATYQIRLSKLGRWNLLPIGIFSILEVMDTGKSPWWAVCLTIFFIATIYAAGLEHRIYKARKCELATLQSKLKNEG